MKNLLLILIIVLQIKQLNAQNIGIGTTSPNPSAQLDVSSSNKGMLLPRMTTIQRKAIVNPATGLIVYDLSKNAIYIYDGVRWIPMLFSAEENAIPPIVREANDGAAGNYFGYSVSIDGDYAIIGSPKEILGGLFNSGSAYIFYKNGGIWQQQVKLTASDAQSEDQFGFSVSISGDNAIVGTYHQPIGSGPVHSAYIFTRNGTSWTQKAKLTASDGVSGDYFGYSVGISGDYAIVGAASDDILSNNNQGSAYLFFKGTGWTDGQAYQAKLLAPDGAAGDFFGYSVSISGSYAIVGAPSDDAEYTNQGAAYIFGRLGTNWPNLAKIKGSVVEGVWFGSSVSINGDYAIVGEPYQNISTYNGNYQGSAYIFNGISGWATNMPYERWINDPEPISGSNGRFGISVSINSDYALIGAYNYGTGDVSNRGLGWLYKRETTGWGISRKIEDKNSQKNSLFGQSISISGFNLIIGAPGKNNSKGDISFLNIE